MTKRTKYVPEMVLGRVVLLRPTGETDRWGKKPWVIVCFCGRQFTSLPYAFKSGAAQSCGCLYLDREGNQNYHQGHGLSKTPEYRIWTGMKTRCHNPNASSYDKYGARGIVVCDRWMHSFLAFLEDMGERPSPDHSVDRIDNAGPYSPENCRWATRVEQAANKRPYPQRTHCDKGHELTGRNAMTRKDRGGHECRKCANARAMARYYLKRDNG